MLNEDQIHNTKAFFLDFDGTLVDSLPVLKQIYMNLMAKMGHQGTEEEFQMLNGPSINEIIHYLKNKYQLKESKESMVELFHHIFTDIYENQIHFFPGAVNFLTWANHQNFRLFIVTSADQSMVSLVLKKYHVENLIEAIISSRDLSNGKPHPEVYQKALLQADLKPGQVIAFEDSENGLLSAKRAKISALAFGEDIKDWDEALSEFKRLES